MMPSAAEMAASAATKRSYTVTPVSGSSETAETPVPSTSKPEPGALALMIVESNFLERAAGRRRTHSSYRPFLSRMNSIENASMTASL